MAKSIISLASALCFLSLLGFAHCDSLFSVEGKVYCDTCRIQFVTRISEYMKDATVGIECRDREGGSITHSGTAVTDASGSYKLAVEEEHEEDICAVSLIKSANSDCSEVSKDPFLKKSARVSLTSNNGISSPVRLANPLGFMKKEALPQCADVLKELGLTASDIL
ncbi:olee1-like protein [Quercus robur]|uniref:olee1-like protein n=1 Tax=Quercus robur TaxID=38942 RepID=UPI0021631F9B|nr:olee1-like protein [Quercus robur]